MEIQCYIVHTLGNPYSQPKYYICAMCKLIWHDSLEHDSLGPVIFYLFSFFFIYLIVKVLDNPSFSLITQYCYPNK